MKTIKIGVEEWKAIQRIKLEKGLSSLNEVIKYLLNGGKKWQ